MSDKVFVPDIPQDRLLYSNCWEDADLLVAALDPGPADTVLSIGSAGDNCFALLSRSPKAVWAYDLSWPQCCLIHLKKAAIAVLSHEQLLQFLGFQESTDRLQVYEQHLAPQLPPEVWVYWSKQAQVIRQGVVHAGRLENYFAKYRRYIQPLVASEKVLDRFFSGPRTATDLAFFKRRVRNPIFRGLLRFLLSRPMLQLMGRTPAFFNEVKGSVSAFLLQQFTAFIDNPESYKNPYMQFIARGTFPNNLPFYLRPETLGLIQQNLDRLHIRQAAIQEGMRDQAGITLINASDLFEYMPRAAFHRFAQRLKTEVPTLRRIAYWNLMVERVLSKDLPDDFVPLQLDPEMQDQIFFYQRFVLEALKP
ncbi:MAG: DUF3419 family protein [Phaeodactylibacter sp.]|nr:DUF3419 family protein [Phaeodactylibacter sp.]